MAGIKEISSNAPLLVAAFLNKKFESITSIKKEEKDWKIILEVLERKAVPDLQDILGIYEVKITENMDLTEYRRIGMRHRGDMIIEEEV